MEVLQLLDGEYKVVLERGDACLSGNVWHVYRNHAGGGLETQVGFLAGRVEPATDEYATHWALELFVRDDIVYDRQLQVTRALRGRRPKAIMFRFTSWANKLWTSGAGGLRSRKPRFPDRRSSNVVSQRLATAFPIELLSALVERSICTEPVVLATHTYASESVLQRGRVWFDDDEEP